MADEASTRLSMKGALLRATRALPQGDPASAARIALHFPPKGKTCATNNRSGHKRKTLTTIKPFGSIDALGDIVVIHHILARSDPICIKHGRRYTWVEEFLVRCEPETCTFGEALKQYRLGFDITSISRRSHSLESFVATKRPNRTQWRSLRRSPLTTPCIGHFAPFPQGTAHIRIIAGGIRAIDTFLAAKTLPMTTPYILNVVESRLPPIKWSSSAQALTRNKKRDHSSPATDPEWRDPRPTLPLILPG
jgi:hypothetical protein